MWGSTIDGDGGRGDQQASSVDGRHSSGGGDGSANNSAAGGGLDDASISTTDEVRSLAGGSVLNDRFYVLLLTPVVWCVPSSPKP